MRIQPARAHHPAVAVVEVAFARLGQRRLVPGVADVDRVAQRVVGDERVLVDPVAVEGAAQEDADAEVDVDQVVGQQLAVDDDAGGDVHRLAPLVHRLVAVVAGPRVLERAPAAEQDAPPADLLVPRKRLVEEVEDVVVHGDRALDEIQDADQPGDVVGEQRRLGRDPHAAGIDGGRVRVTTFHEAEHLPGGPGHLQGLPVEIAFERVERTHDVRDRPVAVQPGARRLGVLRAGQHARVRLFDHRFAEVDEHQVVLEERVVEHVLGGFAEVDDVLRLRRGFDAVGHVLRVHRAGGVVVPADPADAAGDEPGVARVLALHEHRVAAEQRRRAVAFGDDPVGEVDLRVDAEVPDDAGDRVPGHLHDLRGLTARSPACGHRGSFLRGRFRYRGPWAAVRVRRRCGS